MGQHVAEAAVPGAGGLHESCYMWARLPSPVSCGFFLPTQTILLKPGLSLTPYHTAHTASIIPASWSLLRLPSLLSPILLSLWCPVEELPPLKSPL